MQIVLLADTGALEELELGELEGTRIGGTRIGGKRDLCLEMEPGRWHDKPELQRNVNCISLAGTGALS
jgi:hypothetical protein